MSVPLHLFLNQVVKAGLPSCFDLLLESNRLHFTLNNIATSSRFKH